MELIRILKKHNTFSREDVDLIERNVEVKSYASREFFAQSGERSNEIGFVLSGVFRYFFYDANGDEITAHFMAEKEFVGNITSFFEYSPGAGSIQAETGCEVIIIKREAWNLFCEKLPQWEPTLQKIVNEVLIRKTNFQRNLINIDAHSAYVDFLKTYPTIASRVAQNHIASYLGITPFSLSRIRKAIASNKD